MTVANVVPRKIQAGPQVAPWSTSIPFEFFDSSEIEVRRRVTATGVETVLILNTDYTISGGNGATGTLNALTDIQATETWIITRITARTQVTNYQELDRFPAESHEEGLDRLALLVQELDEFLTRALFIAKGDDSLDLTLPRKSARASSFFFWDANGLPTAVQSVTTSGALSATPYMLNTFFALASAAAVRTELAAVENAGSLPKVQRGTLAARPTPGAFGAGVYVATDTFEVFQSDGAAWTELVLTKDTFSALPNTSGVIGVASDRRALYIGTGAAKAKLRSYPPRYLSGGQTSRSAATQITFSEVHCRNHVATGAGNAADDINIDIAAGATIRKDFSAAWTQGDLQGGLAAFPAVANQAYYGFVLGKEDGTVDAGFDTSPTGAALLAVASAAGFNWARRVISFRTRAGSTNIRNYFQYGDWVLYDDPDEDGFDFTDAADRDYTVAGGLLIGLTQAPAGLRSQAKFRMVMKSGQVAGAAVAWNIVCPDIANLAPSLTGTLAVHNAYLDTGDNVRFWPGEYLVMTNAASPPQVRFTAVGDAALQISVITMGWIDDRDKLFP